MLWQRVSPSPADAAPYRQAYREAPGSLEMVSQVAQSQRKHPLKRMMKIHSIILLVISIGCAGPAIGADDNSWQQALLAGNARFAQADYAGAAKRFEQAAREADGFTAPDWRLAGTLNNLGASYVALARYADAEDRLVRALDGLGAVFGDRGAALLPASDTLGMLYLSDGRFAAAEKVLDGAERIARDVFGAGSIEHARTLVSLAALRVHEGREEDARQLLEALVEPGDGDAQGVALAAVIGAAADLEVDLAAYDAAGTRLERAFDLVAGSHDARARATLAALLRIRGRMWMAQGRPGDAREAFEQAFKAAEDGYKSSDPRLADYRANLAMALGAQGRYAEAMLQIKKAGDMTRSALGASHPETVHRLEQMASVQMARGDWKGAAQSLARAGKALKRLPDSHPYRVPLLRLQAALAALRGDDEGAARHLAAAMQLAARVMGDHYPGAAGDLMHAAALAATRNAPAEALRLETEAMDMMDAVFGAESSDPRVAGLLLTGAAVRSSARDPAEAEHRLTRLLQMPEEQLSAAHPYRIRALVEIGTIRRARGDLAGAQTAYEDALARIKTSGIEDSFMEAPVQIALGDLHTAKAAFADAEAAYQRAIEIYEKDKVTRTHPDVAAAKLGLARLQLAAGRYREAEKPLKDARRIQENAFGKDSEHLLPVLVEMARFHLARWRKSDADKARAVLDSADAILARHPEAALAAASVGMQRARLAYAEGRYRAWLSQSEHVVESLGKHVEDDNAGLYAPLVELAGAEMTLGRFDAAQSHLERATAVAQVASAENHPATAPSDLLLAALYRMQGRFGDAEDLLGEVISTLEQSLGGNHPQLAVAFGERGRLYTDMARYEPAEKDYERALQIDKTHFDPGHARVVADRSRLDDLRARSRTEAGISGSLGEVERADLLIARGQYAEALSLLQRALRGATKAKGDGHPEVAGLKLRLASLLVKRGDLQGADKLITEAEPVVREHLGPRHATMARLLRIKGNMLGAARQFPAALGALGEALDILRDSGAAAYREQAACYEDLGHLYLAQTRLDEAEDAYEQARNALESVLGGELHPALMGPLHGLARVFIARGDLDEATSLLDSASRMAVSLYGASHPALVPGLRLAARLSVLRGDPAAAGEILARARTLIERWGDSPELAFVREDMAWLDAADGRLDDAIAAQRDTVNMLNQVLGREHPRTGQGRRALGLHLAARRDFTGAREEFNKALAIMEGAYGTDDALLTPLLLDIARLDRAQDRYPAAEQQLRRALAIDRAAQGSESLAVAREETDLGAVLVLEARLDEAQSLYSHALAVIEDTPDPDTEALATARRNLAALSLARNQIDQAVGFLEQAGPAGSATGAD